MTTPSTRSSYRDMASRSSSSFFKRSAPTSFSSLFSKSQPLSQHSQPNDDSLYLPLECAFFLPSIDSIPMDRYYIAVGDLLGGSLTDFGKIRYGGKQGPRVVMHLCSKEVLEKFILENEVVVIGDHSLPVKKLIDPGLSLFLHNVPPHLPNELLTDELKKFSHLMTELKVTSYGLKDPRLRHILAYKRQVQIRSEDKGNVPLQINVQWKNVNYTMFLSFESPRCFTCGQEGHLSKSCQNSSFPTETPAQKRLDDIKNATPSPLVNKDFPVPLTGGSDPPPPHQDFITTSPTPTHDNTTITVQDLHKNDFMPSFSSDQSSPSLPSDNDNVPVLPTMVQTEYPPLPQSPPPPPPLPMEQESINNKRKISPDVQSDKKPKLNTTTTTITDPEITDGFKIMVAALIENAEEDLSVSAEDVCTLLGMVKNLHKKKLNDTIQKSNVPIDELRKVLLLIQKCPDTTNNMKNRIIRIQSSLSFDSKMVLKNVENVNS